MGDIVEVNFFIRPRALIETLYGERLMVHFHLESASEPTFFHWDDLKPRSSLLVLYPENRTFLDMKQGIRQEDAGTVMVFPVDVEALNQEVSALVRAHQSTKKCCFFCEKVADRRVALKRCTGCHIALYCDRAQCQLPHWKASHRKLCRHSPMLKALVTLDFPHFDNFFDWSFDVTPAPSVEAQNAVTQRSTREFLFRKLAFPRSQIDRMELWLDSLQGKTVREYVAEGPMPWFVEVHLDAQVAETFLAQSMRDFYLRVKEHPAQKHHVVDLKFRGGIEHVQNDILLSGLFTSIALRQHDDFIGGISWACESNIIDFNTLRSCYNYREWELKS